MALILFGPTLIILRILWEIMLAFWKVMLVLLRKRIIHAFLDVL